MLDHQQPKRCLRITDLYDEHNANNEVLRRFVCYEAQPEHARSLQQTLELSGAPVGVHSGVHKKLHESMQNLKREQNRQESNGEAGFCFPSQLHQEQKH